MSAMRALRCFAICLQKAKAETFCCASTTRMWRVRRKNSPMPFAQDLAWLGLHYDETAKQSEHLRRYDQAAFEDLQAQSGLVYACYETPDELERKSASDNWRVACRRSTTAPRCS
jgi:hypothetical protein